MRVSFPGRYGDIIWSMAVMRAIFEATRERLQVVIAGEFVSLVPLLRQQLYIGDAVAITDWSLTPPNEWHCPCPLADIELGYRGWPSEPLPQFIYHQTQREYPDLPMAPLDLARPWITIQPAPRFAPAFTFGMTEAHFELKFGLWTLLERRYRNRYAITDSPLSLCTGARWQQEAGHGGMSWPEAAKWIKTSPVFLGDCSALHVLACAIGTPVICYEPMEARLNAVFWPYGQDGPQVTLVRGLDGLSTCDARHTAEYLEPYLAAHAHQ
jgi:hypothetical protein